MFVKSRDTDVTAAKQTPDTGTDLNKKGGDERRDIMLEWLKAILGDGYTEDIDRKISAEIGKGFVAKADFNAVNEAKKNLENALKERDGQLDGLKNSAGDNAQLKKTIDELQKANAEQLKAHEAEIAQLKLDSAVDAVLTAAGAKNIKTVRALLDLAKIKQGEDGTLDGLDEQLSAVRKSDGYLFAEKQHSFKGFQPGASKDGVPGAEQGGFETRLVSARKDNNQLEVIKIKQEAAANGVVLM